MDKTATEFPTSLTVACICDKFNMYGIMCTKNDYEGLLKWLLL